ncbi:MAG TPA: hypothetical protein VFZ38_17865 [Vicinamibacterales bacterium]
MPRKPPEKIHLSPAECVLKFIGMTRAAKIVNVEPSTVWRWAQPKPKGCGGTVPARHHVDLIDGSGKKLRMRDMVYGRDVVRRKAA